MAMVATDIKSMLSISIKSRHDSHTDQYNRIFMVKLLLVSSLIMGISWFQDSINCMVPGIFYFYFIYCLFIIYLFSFIFCLLFVCFLVLFLACLFVNWQKSIKTYCLALGPLPKVPKCSTLRIGFESAQNWHFISAQ